MRRINYVYPFLLLITCGSTFSLYAQNNTSAYPVNLIPEGRIIYYTDFLTYINPAAAHLQNTFSINAKTGSYTGIRKDISEHYLDLWWRGKDSSRISCGLQFYTNNQGKFIHFTQAKFITRYSIPIDYSINIIPAIGIGFMNYAFDGNSYSAGGSSLVPDIDLGFSLQSRNWNAGISILQLLDKKLHPMSASFDKNTKINFLISRVSYLNNPDYALKYTWVSSYYFPVKKLYSDFTMELCYLHKFKIIALLYHYNVLGLGGGLDEVNTPVGKLGINFIYSKALSQKGILSSNRYELGISYKFK